MSQLTVLHAGLYPAHRELALRLKGGDPDALAEAARTMVRLLDGPTRILLVPVPSHTGRPTALLRLATRVAQMRGHATTAVFPYLRCTPHKSRHDLKHAGAEPKSLPLPSMHFTGDGAVRLLHRMCMTHVPVLLDDVADTGATLLEAAQVTGARHAAVLDVTERTFLSAERPAPATPVYDEPFLAMLTQMAARNATLRQQP